VAIQAQREPREAGAAAGERRGQQQVHRAAASGRADARHGQALPRFRAASPFIAGERRARGRQGIGEPDGRESAMDGMWTFNWQAWNKNWGRASASWEFELPSASRRVA
jgi:hypothetical protein